MFVGGIRFTLGYRGTHTKTSMFGSPVLTDSVAVDRGLGQNQHRKSKANLPPEVVA